MKAILGLIILVLLAVLVGWITFSWTGDRASVNVETDEIERDTEEAVRSGREFIGETEEEIEQAEAEAEAEDAEEERDVEPERLDDTADETPAPATTPETGRNLP